MAPGRSCDHRQHERGHRLTRSPQRPGRRCRALRCRDHEFRGLGHQRRRPAVGYAGGAHHRGRARRADRCTRRNGDAHRRRQRHCAVRLPMAPGRRRDHRQRQRHHDHAGYSGCDVGRRRQLRCGYHQRPRRCHQRAVCAHRRGRAAAGGGVGFLGGGARPRAAGRCHRRHGRAAQQQRHHAHADHGFRFERLRGRDRHLQCRRGRARRSAQSRRGRLGVF